MYALFPVYPLQCGKCGGIFLWGSKGMFPDSRKPLLPAPGGCWEGKSAPAGRRFWNERSTDEKEKTYDKRCEWDEEKCGRPALGRTRKLTRGVTVKFSPSATRLSGSGQGSPAGVWRSISGRQHWRPPLRQGIHRRRTHCCAAWREWRTT